MLRAANSKIILDRAKEAPYISFMPIPSAKPSVVDPGVRAEREFLESLGAQVRACREAQRQAAQASEEFRSRSANTMAK